MTEAIFGLLGVVIGSAITWGIELWRARRTDADQARVAARLVADELRSISNARTVDEPQFRRERELALQQDAWVTHRVTLARELTDDDWRRVREAYDALAVPERGMVSERFVDDRYEQALNALQPVASSNRRYWWQRARQRFRREQRKEDSGG
jgi:hypothetical protein